MSETPTCAVCDATDDALGWRWTDTHGIAVCTRCGCPYRLIHYEGETPKRIEKPPTLALSDEGLRMGRAYWSARRRIIFPGMFDLAGSTYSGWTADDVECFNAWLKVDRSKIRAWQVCPEDVVAAETWDEACAFHVRELGSDRADLGDEPEEADLSRMMRREAVDAQSERITLAQAIAEAASFPCLLCSTEY